MCGKMSHRCRDHAWLAIGAMYRRGMAEPGSLHPYPCDRCYPWRVFHVGHSPVWRRIEAAREAERARLSRAWRDAVVERLR